MYHYLLAIKHLDSMSDQLIGLNYHDKLNEFAGIIHPDDKLDGTFDYSTADRDAYLSRARNTDWADLLFRRNSGNGQVECLTNKTAIELNEELHANN